MTTDAEHGDLCLARLKLLLESQDDESSCIMT